jgi:hypothetical protein
MGLSSCAQFCSGGSEVVSLGSLLGSVPGADPSRPRICNDEPMPDPAPKPDAIEQANAVFWNPPTLEELMADVPPLTSMDDLAIPDLTDEEWEAFVAALNE